MLQMSESLGCDEAQTLIQRHRSEPPGQRSPVFIQATCSGRSSYKVASACGRNQRLCPAESQQGTGGAKSEEIAVKASNRVRVHRSMQPGADALGSEECDEASSACLLPS